MAYDEREEKPTIASEPVAEYGVKGFTRMRVHGCNANVTKNTETTIKEEFAHKIRVQYARCEAQGLSREQTIETLKERLGLIDLETMRANLHQMVKEVYAQP